MASRGVMLLCVGVLGAGCGRIGFTPQGRGDATADTAPGDSGGDARADSGEPDADAGADAAGDAAGDAGSDVGTDSGAGGAVLAFDFATGSLESLDGTYVMGHLRDDSGQDAASYVDASGLIAIAAAGAPRFSHDPLSSEALGLLIEDAGTNLVTQSDSLGRPSWVTFETTLPPAPAVTAPNGSTDAVKLVEDATPNYHGLTQEVDIDPDSVFTISVFGKRAEAARGLAVRAQRYDSGQPRCKYDFGTDSFLETGESISCARELFPNGWVRVVLTFNSGTGAFVAMAKFEVFPVAMPLGDYMGDGTSGVYLWGAQLEPGPFATSYIRSGTTRGTRGADELELTTGDWYDPAEGTFFVEAAPGDDGGGRPALWAVDGTSHVSILRDLVGTRVTMTVVVNGMDQAVAQAATWDARQWRRVAVALRMDDTAFALDGAVIANRLGGEIPASIASLHAGRAPGSTSTWNGHVRRIEYHGRRLDGPALMALTAP